MKKNTSEQGDLFCYLYEALVFLKQFHRTWQLECQALSVLVDNDIMNDEFTQKSRGTDAGKILNIHFIKDYWHKSNHVFVQWLRSENSTMLLENLPGLRSDISSWFNSHHELELWGETRDNSGVGDGSRNLGGDIRLEGVILLVDSHFPWIWLDGGWEYPSG